MFLSNFSAWLTRQVKQERRKQAQLEDLTQTFILEPIYTPGGLLDGGDDSEGLDLDPLDDISDSPDWNGEDDLDLDGDDGGDEVVDEGDDSLDNDGEIVEDPVDLDDDVSDEEIGDEIPFADESEEGESETDEEISDELDESEEGESETDEEISDELDESEEGETDGDEEISDELDESEEGESEADEEISDEPDESEETEAETDDDISDEGDDEEAGEAEADDDGEDNEDESEDPLDDEEDGEDEEEDEDDDELPFSFSVLDFDRGVFRVGDSGEVGVDFLFDGGAYQGEVAFFSLAGLEEMEFETTEQFIAEAAKRAASGSAQGHTVISVADEGARFTGSLFNEPDWNTGPYQGVKTFNMTPGDEFGVMLVPNGRVSDVVSNPSIGGSRRPLFSLSTANPDDEFHLGQIADLTGDGNTFVFEDKRFEISDYDYDDVIFQIRGAVGDAVYVGDVIAEDLDWRDDDMGKALLAYAKPYITPVNNEQWDLGELAEFGDEAMNSGDDLPSEVGGSETEVDLDDLDEVTTEDTETDDLDEAEDEADVAETDDSDDSSSEESVADSGSSETDESSQSSTETFEPSGLTEDSSESQADGSLESETTADDAVEIETPDEVTSSDEVEETVQITEDSDEESMVSEGEESVGEENDSQTPTAEAQPIVTPERFELAKEDQPLVGIIDTGFAENNPDLDYDNITLGRDWVDGDDNPLLAEGEGNEHGTHILGIIAAQQDNGIGIDGINPDAPIWLGRAVGSGEWANSLVEFVDAAVESGQPNAVVNLSMDLTQMDAEGNVTTRYELTPMERAAIEYARQNNVMIVAAAGNDGGVMSALGQASQEFDNIMTVGAAEQFDPDTSVWKGADRTDYSSYGHGLDVMAYGGTVDNPKLSLAGDGLGTMSGTSVATAKVTGAVSQVWAANPELSYRQVVEIIRDTATDLGSTGWNTETGTGLLNMTAAVHLAKATKPEVHFAPSSLIPESWSGEGTFTPGERAVRVVSETFTGWPMPAIGTAYRYSTRHDDRVPNPASWADYLAEPHGKNLTFDAWTYGERVTDYQLGTPDELWYRVSGTNYWMPSAYIYGFPGSRPPVLKPATTPIPTPTPAPTNPSLANPILSRVNLDYFRSRPEFYTTGNIFHNSGWGSNLLGGGWRSNNNGGHGTRGNCTWYAHGRLLELGGNRAALQSMSGNASQWHNQISNGTQIVSSPQPGDIAQWSESGNHVAVVEKVNLDGTIVISESHWMTDLDGGGPGTLHDVRTISASNPDRFLRVPGVQVQDGTAASTAGTFTGRVIATIGAYLRATPNKTGNPVGSANYGATLTFDKAITGEHASYPGLGTSSDQWYRVAGTNQWISAALIHGSPQSSVNNTPATPGEQQKYIIKAGDTLWDIARRYLGDGNRWREIQKADGSTFTEEEGRNLQVGQSVYLPVTYDSGNGNQEQENTITIPDPVTPEPVTRFEIAKQAAIKRVGENQVGQSTGAPRYVTVGNSSGWVQEFEPSLLSTPPSRRLLMLEDGADTAYWIEGENLKEYEAVGGLKIRNPLGFPRNDETPSSNRSDVFWQAFSGTNGTPRIHRNISSPSVASWGPISDKYEELWAVNGSLGAPTKRQWLDADGFTVWAEFERGQIAYNSKTGHVTGAMPRNSVAPWQSDRHTLNVRGSWRDISLNFVDHSKAEDGIGDRPTWIITHGWNSESVGNENFTNLAQTIGGYKTGDQVIKLDWRELANTGLRPLSLVEAASWIEPIGEAVTNKLGSWGLESNQINLVGHSLGAYVSFEIARNLNGSNSLVALDPAATTHGGYSFDEDKVDYESQSEQSLALVTSSLGHLDNSKTATDSFNKRAQDIEGAPWYYRPDIRHSAAVPEFTSWVKNKNDSVSKLFNYS